MPMCSLGCDDLYERGYVAVKDGRVALLGKKPTTPALADYVSAIEGNKCTHWRTGTMPYFQWHYETHSSSATYLRSRIKPKDLYFYVAVNRMLPGGWLGAYAIRVG